MNKLPFAIVLFLLGLYFVVKYPTVEAFTLPTKDRCADLLIQEGSTFALYNSKIKNNVPGVNPIIFKSLDEYVEFTDWQRQQGIMCPILYLQQAEDIQGNLVYKARPSPTNMQGGLPDLMDPLASEKRISKKLSPEKLAQAQAKQVQGYDNISASLVLPRPSSKTVIDKVYEGKDLLIDASRDDSPFNVNSYPGFDGQNQDIGRDTPLDKMFNDSSEVSPNPMDENWGGAKCTAYLVDRGYYKDNEVYRNTGSGLGQISEKDDTPRLNLVPASDRTPEEKQK